VAWLASGNTAAVGYQTTVCSTCMNLQVYIQAMTTPTGVQQLLQWQQLLLGMLGCSGDEQPAQAVATLMDI
jgi:hypothetical protein